MKIGQGLARAERITRAGEYRTVFTKGRTFREGPFMIGVLKSHFKRHRLGISISAKRVRLATSRNRLRRLIKEVFRTNKSQYLDEYYDIVVSLCKRTDTQLTYKYVSERINSLLRKAGVKR